MITIYCDGGCIVGKGIGARSYVIVKDGKIIKMAGAVINRSGLTNNQAEYDAIIHALAIGSDDGNATIVSDSEVVIKQITGEYKVKDEELKKKHRLVMFCIGGCQKYTFINAPRENKYIQMADKMNHIIMDEAKPKETIPICPWCKKDYGKDVPLNWEQFKEVWYCHSHGSFDDSQLKTGV
jgi:ribonuclease HI